MKNIWIANICAKNWKQSMPYTPLFLSFLFLSPQYLPESPYHRAPHYAISSSLLLLPPSSSPNIFLSTLFLNTHCLQLTFARDKFQKYTKQQAKLWSSTFYLYIFKQQLE